MSFLYFLFWKEGLGSDLETLRNENEERATPICTSFQFQPFNWTRTGSCTTLKNRLNIRIVHPSQCISVMVPVLAGVISVSWTINEPGLSLRIVLKFYQKSKDHFSVRSNRVDRVFVEETRVTRHACLNAYENTYSNIQKYWTNLKFKI